MDRMSFPPYRWLVTYFHAWYTLSRYGERGWPWNIQQVWSVARQQVDAQYPRKTP